jgi:hypothetical protein
MMGNLVRALYVSEASPEGLIQFSQIVSQSAAKNCQLGVTGVLFRQGEHFVQVLEGERERLQALLSGLDDGEPFSG